MDEDKAARLKKKRVKKYVIFSAMSCLIVLFVIGLALYFWMKGYDNRIPPNSFVANLDVSGMEEKTANQILQEKIDELLTNGLNITTDGETQKLTFASISSADLMEDVGFDIEESLKKLMALHDENQFKNLISLLSHKIVGSKIGIPVKINHEKIQEQITFLFPDKETLSRDAGFIIEVEKDGGVSVAVAPPQDGNEFQWEQFFVKLEHRLSYLNNETIELKTQHTKPAISEQNAIRQVTNALDAITSAPYSVRLTLENLEWQMTKEELSKMLTPGENGELDFHNGQFQEWTRRISDTVDRPARDASIEVTNGRVINFTESRDGQSADIDILKKDLLSSVRGQSGEAIELQINIEKPRIETGDANDLGITQALGAGISNYKGSPMNRRANIQNGVNLLNGILIAPGETFSLLKALAPFSTDNGYLPELVIKGDKITPEIGGGLCQIGTTTFRAAMNSGLPIIERQNHSIVVSYYNDPSNGNPGTDATIYEPVPDLKFVNDTADFILFQAENKTETQELKFTFWGTTDGRIGSYSAPTVLRWIPVGEDVRTETSDLEPGTETCQSAHIGADTTFVYTITKLDGTSVQTQFDSHYRPLPKICLVGAEEKTEDETPDVEDQTDSALEN